MKQDGSLALFQYWNSLRGTRSAPNHAEIEPVKIKKYLQDTLILGPQADNSLIFRLAGTRLCTNYRKELRGCAIETLWNSDDHANIRTVLQQVIEDHCALSIQFEGISKSKRVALFEFIALPLHSANHQTRILGIIQAIEPPYWLGREPLVQNRLVVSHLIDPVGDLTASPASPHSSAGTFLQISTDNPKTHRVRHLTVIEGMQSITKG